MTCDHPKCSDAEHKTYRDEHDNELELCEAHYYYLVSGKNPPRTRPDPFRSPGLGTPDFSDPVSALEDLEPERPRRRGGPES